MMNKNNREVGPRRALFLLLTGLLATLLVLGMAQITLAGDDKPDQPIPDIDSWEADGEHSAADAAQIQSRLEYLSALEFGTLDQLSGSDLSTSTKDVDFEQAQAGSIVEYLIVARNTGDANVSVTMTDTLPFGLTYVSHERLNDFSMMPDDPEFTLGANEVIWKGQLGPSGFVEIAIEARVDESVPAGTVITNMAQISGGGETVSPSVKVTVLEKPDIYELSLPMAFVPLPPDPPDITNLTATRPNSANQFRLSWTIASGVLANSPSYASHFIVEQANNPNFTSPIQYNTGKDMFLDLQPQPSWQNDFYFRVRSFENTTAGNWSETINVVGAYFDGFDDRNSGWAIRRSTNLSHVDLEYENYDRSWIVMDVGDKWDWGIASSLAKAPEPPYVIQYDGKFAQTPNEVAMGIVFGGDLTGDKCKEFSPANDFYTHDECFNHFYNPQYFWAGESLNMIWQRVDYLQWCPDCGGSPMKRRGDTWKPFKMTNVDNDDWNRHRIEVRDGSIKYYVGRPFNADLTLQLEYGDTRYIDEPYFGVFAYAGEYTSSIARFDNFSITPLDN